jgi:hypothetical protein
MLVPNSGLTISFTSSGWFHVLLPRSWHCHNSGGVQKCRPGQRSSIYKCQGRRSSIGRRYNSGDRGIGASHPTDTKETLKDVPQPGARICQRQRRKENRSSRSRTPLAEPNPELNQRAERIAEQANNRTPCLRHGLLAHSCIT